MRGDREMGERGERRGGRGSFIVAVVIIIVVCVVALYFRCVFQSIFFYCFSIQFLHILKTALHQRLNPLPYVANMS